MHARERTQHIVQLCWIVLWRSWPNARNISTQHSATLSCTTCCMHTFGHPVAAWCFEIENWTSAHAPVQQCCTVCCTNVAREYSRDIQKCCTNNLNILIHQHAATYCNRVAKCQMCATSCQQQCFAMLRAFGPACAQTSARRLDRA